MFLLDICALVWWVVVLVLSFVLVVRYYRRLERKTDPEKRRDTYLGFFGALVLNLCLVPVILALYRLDLDWDTTPGWLSLGIALLRLGLPWVANFVPLVIFAIVRQQIAHGAIAFFGFLVAWAVLAGGLSVASCLVLAPIYWIAGQ